MRNRYDPARQLAGCVELLKKIPGTRDIKIGKGMWNDLGSTEDHIAVQHAVLLQHWRELVSDQRCEFTRIVEFLGDGLDACLVTMFKNPDFQALLRIRAAGLKDSRLIEMSPTTA